MELLLEVKDSKASIFMEILKEFSYVKVKKQTNAQEDDEYCQKLYDEAIKENLTYRPLGDALKDIEKLRTANGL